MNNFSVNSFRLFRDGKPSEICVEHTIVIIRSQFSRSQGLFALLSVLFPIMFSDLFIFLPPIETPLRGKIHASPPGITADNYVTPKTTISAGGTDLRWCRAAAGSAQMGSFQRCKSSTLPLIHRNRLNLARVRLSPSLYELRCQFPRRNLAVPSIWVFGKIGFSDGSIF